MNNYIMKAGGPCRGCERRTVSPNCHDPERCEDWKGFQQTLAENRKIRKCSEADIVRKTTGKRVKAFFYKEQK